MGGRLARPALRSAFPCSANGGRHRPSLRHEGRRQHEGLRHVDDHPLLSKGLDLLRLTVATPQEVVHPSRETMLRRTREWSQAVQGFGEGSDLYDDRDHPQYTTTTTTTTTAITTTTATTTTSLPPLPPLLPLVVSTITATSATTTSPMARISVRLKGGWRATATTTTVAAANVGNGVKDCRCYHHYSIADSQRAWMIGTLTTTTTITTSPMARKSVRRTM